MTKHVACPACGQSDGVGKRGGLRPHKFNGEPCSGKAARCKVCDALKPLRSSRGVVIKHFGVDGFPCAGSNRKPRPEPAEIHEGELQCPVCRKGVPQTDNGTVSGHNGKRGAEWCAGSGLKVAAPTPKANRADDRTDSTSIRTISSGLGSLGKR